MKNSMGRTECAPRLYKNEKQNKYNTNTVVKRTQDEMRMMQKDEQMPIHGKVAW